MSRILVVIKDEKTGAFQGDPMGFDSLPDCMRRMTHAIKSSPDTGLAQFPADFSFWQIAKWDNVGGQLDVLFTKEYLFNAADLVPQKEVKNGNG